MNKQTGFTMIELIVVIVILGILGAVALPKFIDFSSDAATAAVAGVAGGAVVTERAGEASRALAAVGTRPRGLAGAVAAANDVAAHGIGVVVAVRNDRAVNWRAGRVASVLGRASVAAVRAGSGAGVACGAHAGAAVDKVAVDAVRVAVAVSCNRARELLAVREAAWRRRPVEGRGSAGRCRQRSLPLLGIRLSPVASRSRVGNTGRVRSRSGSGRRGPMGRNRADHSSGGTSRFPDFQQRIGRLDPVDRCLHCRVKILHAKTGAGDPEALQSAIPVIHHVVRINLDADFGVPGDGECPVELGAQCRHVLSSHQSRRPAAQMDRRDNTPPRQMPRHRVDLRMQRFQICH